ncbi:MAG TPA: sialidase family protein [Longimicrobiales bacterium]|nr:sialidase family protein [Longimicrobiales bacterium]
MGFRARSILFAGAALCLAAPPLSAQEHPAVVLSEFIYDDPPTPECHASTIVETPSGLVTAWFGGEYERHPEVKIWVARYEGGRWTAPVAVADGVQPDGTPLPTWNPVLFQPTGGRLFLFYKVGPSPSTWWGMVMTSDDDGRTWTEPHRLPDGVYGPIRSKPVQLANGVILAGSSTEHDGWRVHFEASRDGGATWEVTGPMNDGFEIGAIQPTIMRHTDGRIQAIGRTRQNRIFTIESTDGGESWGPLTLTDLPNPSAGIEIVTLFDGRHLLVYNHTVRSEGSNGRGTLNLAISEDGVNWEAVMVLEHEPDDPVGFAYPAAIQTTDGLVHITYTWKRVRVKHIVIDPAMLTTIGPIVNGQWPAE